ncbi:MAG: RNA methyltransferase [Bacteroidales bacterium]
MRKLANEELGRLDIPSFKSAGKNRVTVVLDNVRSLNNIGSIFRSCDAFLVEKLILCGISTPPPHRDIHKSALGAELSVDWQYLEQATDAVVSLKEQGYNVLAIEQTTGSISLKQVGSSLSPPQTKGSPIAIVLGHEIRGVSQEVVDLCDASVEIPQHGTKHSLNVAVAAGIVLWELIGSV